MSGLPTCASLTPLHPWTLSALSLIPSSDPSSFSLPTSLFLSFLYFLAAFIFFFFSLCPYCPLLYLSPSLLPLSTSSLDLPLSVPVSALFCLYLASSVSPSVPESSLRLLSIGLCVLVFLCLSLCLCISFSLPLLLSLCLSQSLSFVSVLITLLTTSMFSFSPVLLPPHPHPLLPLGRGQRSLGRIGSH